VEMRRVMSEIYAPATLFRLQALVLFSWYFYGTKMFASAGWALIGLSLRYAQDTGIHLKKGWTKRAAAHPFEYEMRKRVFWALYSIERTMTLEMDRSICLQEDDHDVDLPLELDDAALDLLQQGQTNPPGFSYDIATFNARMRLLSFRSRKRTELRAIRRMSKESDVLDRELYWLQSIRTKLDHFMANLPENLKYDEREKDDDIYLARALLKLQYHQIQFAIYRPFLSRAKREVHASEPILEICSAVSRSIAQILDVMRQRNLLIGRIHETSLGGFIAGTVLLIEMWENRNDAHMDAVEKCLQAIKSIEHRWQWPRRVYDVLFNLRELIRIAMRNVDQPDQDVNNSELTEHSPVQQTQNPFPFAGSESSQNAPHSYSFASLLRDGIIPAQSTDNLGTSQLPGQPPFSDQAMAVDDWTFPNLAAGAADAEFNDWLNNILFTNHPSSDPTSS